MYRQLKRSSADYIISGVCGGIANFLGVPSLFVRLIFVFTPVSILLYAAMAYFIPADQEIL
ncbi:PspC domain-containing protein [Halobacillus litoralis]|uniref:PspC domain-containing protein n=1 Tax=Halobacillus litoralis TaxID=45668 RepID=A0A845E5D4_9BACI|nr:PspC domain-containing protein [Halobacillus litoralis]